MMDSDPWRLPALYVVLTGCQWSDGATALYDLDADPEQTCNASADEASAPVAAELRQKPASLPPWPAPAGK